MDMRSMMILVENAPSGQPIKLYHITDNAKFKLNPNFAPEDNSFSIHDRSGNKGIYLTPDVERWVNGHGYIRPFVAEILAEPTALEHDTLGRWGGEIFIPADQFDKLQVVRVLPLDAYAREKYGAHGWIEQNNGHAFDTGEPIQTSGWPYVFTGYKYPGDTRNMSADEIRHLKRHFSVGYKQLLKNR